MEPTELRGLFPSGGIRNHKPRLLLATNFVYILWLPLHTYLLSHNGPSAVVRQLDLLDLLQVRLDAPQECSSWLQLLVVALVSHKLHKAATPCHT